VLSEEDVVGWIATQSKEFVATIRADALDHKVPSCPAWTLRDLVWHLGRVQRFWAKAVRTAADTEPKFEAAQTGPHDADGLARWMRESTHELLQSLHDHSWATPAWTWWKHPRTVGAIARHQVQEAAVHRWDAQLAIGTPEPLPDAVAADGFDEFLEIARQLRDSAPITFVAIDTGRSFDLSDGNPRATVSATAADLVLLLHGRRTLTHADVEGDPMLVEAFLVPIG
jgi:uncharacterized protein (TIGR03083 family)